MNEKIIADYYRLGLKHRFFDGQDVIDWALETIGKENVVSAEISNILLLNPSNIKAIYDQLLEITGEDHFTESTEMVMAELNRRFLAGQLSLQRTCQLAYYFSRDGNLPEEQFFRFIRIDDEFQLASKNIYGSLEEVEKELRLALAEYSSKIDS